MAAGVKIKHKRKAGIFADGELDAGEIGIDTTNDALYFSGNGTKSRTLEINNFSIADQTVSANSTALVTGSVINIPATGLKVGSIIRWELTIAKTAAGTAARTIVVQLGTAGTTADADIISFTMPAGTAAIDKGKLEVLLTVRSIGAAGIIAGTLTMVHNLSTTGLANVPGVVLQQNSAGVNTTTANLKLSLVMTTGANEVITISQVFADTKNL